MASKGETNLEKLYKHKNELSRLYARRDYLNQRIAKLEARVQAEENEEYLRIVHGAAISLEDLMQMLHGQGQDMKPAPFSCNDERDEEDATENEDGI